MYARLETTGPRRPPYGGRGLKFAEATHSETEEEVALRMGGVD